MWENMVGTDRPGMAIYYDACALGAGYLTLQTHIHNLIHIAFHGKNRYVNAPEYYVILTLSV